MRISLRKVVIVLAILTSAMTVASVYAYVDSLSQPASGPLIWAYEVDHVPSYGVLITDPHPILIEAIERSLEHPYPDREALIYLAQASNEDYEAVYEQLGDWTTRCYVEYEGKYYGISEGEAMVGLEPSLLHQLPLAFSALGVCWVVVGYSYHRNKKTTRHEKD